MDFMGILKEAWTVTWRERRLWILGLFAAGSVGVSSINWDLGSADTSSQGPEFTGMPTGAEIQKAIDEAGREIGVSLGSVNDWWIWIAVGVMALVVIGLVFWVLSIAARGGLIEQTREAIAERPTSVRAGWRTGWRYWGRVFVVGLLLAIPILVFGGIASLGAVIAGTLIIGGEGAVQATAGVVAAGAVVALFGLITVVVSVILSMVQEVAYRYAILEDRGAVDSIKTGWNDLFQRRGVASMWLVLVVADILATIAGGIVFVPIALIVSVIVAGAVFTAGTGMLWLLVPLVLIGIALGFVFKAIYTTFTTTAWTSFFVRIERPELEAE